MGKSLSHKEKRVDQDISKDDISKRLYASWSQDLSQIFKSLWYHVSLNISILTLIPYLAMNVNQTTAASIDSSKPVPSPEIVQAKVWNVMQFQDFKMEGVLKVLNKDKVGKSKSVRHPVILRVKDRTMVYEFQENPLHIRVDFTSTGSNVMTRKKKEDPWKILLGTERTKQILNTDASFEDLGIDFIRWENARGLGYTKHLNLFDSWAYEASPSIPSQYAKAQYWISSEFFAVLRVFAFNSKGQMIKKVEVQDVMQVGDAFLPKEIKIASVIPGRNLSRSMTLIQIKDATTGSGL
ncbi:MAG: outer membrane lipoprotein-sorting protein [Verrucomicrobiota bacterium]